MSLFIVRYYAGARRPTQRRWRIRGKVCAKVVRWRERAPEHTQAGAVRRGPSDQAQALVCETTLILKETAKLFLAA